MATGALVAEGCSADEECGFRAFLGGLAAAVGALGVEVFEAEVCVGFDWGAAWSGPSEFELAADFLHGAAAGASWLGGG